MVKHLHLIYGMLEHTIVDTHPIRFWHGEGRVIATYKHIV
jgi:hypothetical protein